MTAHLPSRVLAALAALTALVAGAVRAQNVPPPKARLPPVTTQQGQGRSSDGAVPASGTASSEDVPVRVGGGNGILDSTAVGVSGVAGAGEGEGIDQLSGEAGGGVLPLRSEAHFTAIAALRPRRLAPGQQGNLHVVVTLRGDSVVLPGAHIKLVMNSAGSPLELGTPVRRPPREAEFAARYRGQKVYDDSIEFLIPVQARAGAEMKRHFINGSIELDVTTASTGQSVGRVTGPVSGAVKIGKPLPTPTINRQRRANRAASRESGDQAKPTVGLPNQETTGDVPGSVAAGLGSRSTATLETATLETASGADPGPLAAMGEVPAAESDDSLRSYGLIGGGAVAVLILLGLLLRRRRH